MASDTGKKASNTVSVDLPEISRSMVRNFFFGSSAAKVAETKANAYNQRSHEDAIISCVCVKRQNRACVVKSSVYIKQKGRQKFCTVVLTVNEEKQVVQNLRCMTCAHGGCGHALALLKYLQNSSNEKNENKVSNSSNQVGISEVGIITLEQKTSGKKNLENQNLKNGVPNIPKQQSTEEANKRNFTTTTQVVEGIYKDYPKSNKDIKDVYCVLKENQSKEFQAQSKKNFSLIVQPTTNISSVRNIQDVYSIIPVSNKKHVESINNLRKSDILNLSLDNISFQCSSKGIHTVEDFLAYAKIKMNKNLCEFAEQETRQQSASSIWHRLRYGRITASKMHETSQCRTTNGKLVQEILGLTKIYENVYMRRGKELEDEVFKQVLKLGYKVKKCGFFLHADYPYLGASPDGIGKDFILEIKCPASQRTFENYLRNGKITKKCKAQVLLQMLMTGKTKGLFCVAHYNFEYNKQIFIDWVEYDEEEMTALIIKVSNFWENNIYPRLN